MVAERQQRQPGFYLVSLAWIVTALLLAGLMVVGAVYNFRQLTQPGSYALLTRLGATPEVAAIYSIVSKIAPASICALLGLLLFIRLVRSRQAYDRMAMFTAFMLLTFSLLNNGTVDSIPEDAIFWQVAYTSIGVLGSALFFLFMLIFPDGRFVPRWSRWIPLAFLVWMASWFIFPSLNPAYMPELTVDLIVGVWLVLALATQVYRYRRYATSVQRQQTKWVAYSLILLIVFSFVDLWIEQVLLPRLETGSIGVVLFLPVQLIFDLGWLIFPVALVMAIARHRLWEIDSLINKTLVYALLTMVLAGIYIGSVVALQQVFRIVSGQENSLALAVSTLGTAALFNPLRKRIQVFIDRRFYRARYDADRALAKFGQRVRSDVEFERLGENLILTIQETIQPEFVALWLLDPKSSHSEMKEALRMLMELDI